MTCEDQLWHNPFAGYRQNPTIAHVMFKQAWILFENAWIHLLPNTFDQFNFTIWTKLDKLIMKQHLGNGLKAVDSTFKSNSLLQGDFSGTYSHKHQETKAIGTRGDTLHAICPIYTPVVWGHLDGRVKWNAFVLILHYLRNDKYDTIVIESLVADSLIPRHRE